MLIYKGIEYARVSDILQPFCDFSHVPPDILGRKQILGIQLHEAIEDWIKKGFPLLTPECAGYFQSFRSWRSRVECEFTSCERRLYCHERRITGKIDALAMLQKEEMPILVDWKTSVAESPTWILQGHLYHYLLKVNLIPTGDRFLFLKLHPKGYLPQVYEYKFDENILFKCFEAIDLFWSAHS